MRRLRIILLAGLLVVALAPAAAAKVKPPPAPPEHPAGMSCEEAVTYDGATHVVMSWAPTPDRPTLDVMLAKDDPLVCIDVSNATGGDFTIEVTDPGTAHTLRANVRDSHPGDFCAPGAGIDLRKASTLTFAGIPAATLNACGSDYSEWFLDEDGIPSQTHEQDLEQSDPLVLTIVTGPTRTDVWVAVTYYAG